MKKLFSLALVLVLALSMMVCVSAEEAEATTPTIDEAMASDRWVTVHRWDFDGNADDSVGGVKGTLVTDSGYAAPTFADGKITVAGTTAYKLSKTLTFTGEGYEGLTGLRVDFKASINWNPDAAFKKPGRIFGSASGNTKQSGVCVITMVNAGLGMTGYDISMQGDVQGSCRMVLDPTKLNSDEALYSVVYYEGNCYVYVNGVQLATGKFQGGGWRFDDLLGCSWATNYGVVGTFDYIDVSMFGPEIHTCTPSETYEKDDTHHWKVCTDTACGKEIEGSKEAHVTEGTCVCGKVVSTPSQGGDDTTGDNPETGLTLIVLPVALVAATGVIATTKKRSK